MSELPPPPPPNMAPPPGYVAYGGGYSAAGGTFRPVGTLGKWLVALLCVTLAAQALLVVVQLTLKDAAEEFLSVGNIDAFDDKLVTYLGLGALAAIAALAQLVILVIWTWRMAKNAQVLGRQPQSFGPGATIAVNLLGSCTLGILPFFMWRELWRASDPQVAPGDPSWKQGLVPALIPVHLAFSIASIVSSISINTGAGVTVGWTSGGSRKEVAERLSDKLPAIVASGLFAAGAAVVFLLIARQLTARHMQATREG